MNEATCESRGASLHAVNTDLIQIVALYASCGDPAERRRYNAVEVLEPFYH
ncbi:hypothetical protein EV130_11315 [Rhizobium azibense]|uniref:Uncharacterized protein n=1 Tax=Rhizobium azibense TaxID=1136135 RepID=A0A4R3QDA5_9HYPH|nr:hypothetical protein EV130_11315 [Rhizobium azibense]